MRFYKNQHQFYIGIDLHARNMYVCVINNHGEKVFHKNMACSENNLETIINTFGNEILVNIQLPQEFKILQTIPGFGFIIPLTILYEIGEISRFKNVGHFLSYARLVKCTHNSADKKQSGGNNKIGNVHLKWAFSEAAVMILSRNTEAKKWYERLVSRYGKAKAMSVIAQKLGRTVFYMLKRNEAFDEIKFYTGQ